MRGYDISHHNKEKEIKELLDSDFDRPQYMYIKRSEGLNTVQIDYFERMRAYAHIKGIAVGGYHYINPNAAGKNYGFDFNTIASVEASRLISLDNDVLQLVPMMDVEEKYLLTNVRLLAEYLEKVCDSFFRQGGKKVGIYASYSLLCNEAIKEVVKTYDMPVWCARYMYKDTDRNKMTATSTIKDLNRNIQRFVSDIPVAFNQIGTVYYDNKGIKHNLDCDVILRPMDIMRS